MTHSFKGVRGRPQETAAGGIEAARSWHGQGLAAIAQGRLDEAEAWLRKAYASAPQDPAIAANLGALLLQSGQFAEAAATLRAALRLKPDSISAHDNLGGALQALGDFAQAEAEHRAALALDPGHAAAWCNLGNALRAQARLEEAIACYARALALKPRWPHAEWNRALAYLLEGDLARGWASYAWRIAAGKVRFPTLPLPLWDGGAPEGRRVLIYGEQGVGDEIMFASCLPDLSAAGAVPVVVCEPRLAPLFARSFPAAEVSGTRREGAASETPPPAECWLPAGSLPRLFRGSRDAFPRTPGYLRAEDAATQEFRARLGAAAAGRLAVGIAWRGGREGMERRRRSTTLADWQPLVRIPGVRFVDLQYGDRAHERAESAAAGGLVPEPIDGVDPLSDLDRYAALIAALDLVVAVDSAVVHLAGALGKPVWTLVPIPPDWRWMAQGTESPWYPTARLYRQERPGEWSGVFRRVAADLARLVRFEG